MATSNDAARRRATWPAVDLLAVSLAALVHRLLWLRWAPRLLGDSDEYLRIARHLVEQGVFSENGHTPSSYRPPLYPAMLAALSWLSGDAERSIVAVQVAAGVATVAMTYVVAARFFGRAPALIGAMCLALAPLTARYDAIALTETMFVSFLMAGVALWSAERPIAAGVAFGLATLTRGSLLPYLLGMLLLSVARVPKARTLRIVALTALLTTAPWVARNIIQVGRVTLADAGWGTVLIYGTVDVQSGSNAWPQLLHALPANQGLSLEESERRNMRLALSAIRESPVAWLSLRVRQLPRLWFDTGDYLPLRANELSFRQALTARYAPTILIKVFFLAGHTLLLLCAAFGVWTSAGRLAALSPIWSFPLYAVVAQLPMFVDPRYGLPLVPFVLIWAGRGIHAIVAAAGGQDQRYWLRRGTARD